MRRIVIALVLAVSALIPVGVGAFTSPGAPSGFVNDYTGTLSPAVEQQLETELEQFKKDTSHEIAVVMIATLGDEILEDYANALFREWGVGTKENNNGLLFLVVKDDRKMRVEVGYGLEGAVTDTETKYIQDDFVRPLFRDGDYEGGVRVAVEQLMVAAKEEVVPVSTNDSGANSLADFFGGLFGQFFEIIFILAFLLFDWIVSIFGRSKSWWLGGVVGSIIGLAVWAILGWWWATAALGLGGLFFDYIVSKNYKAGKKSWWAGGTGGGWDAWSSGSSGGSSFGGFGGGSSGGGGSSSSW